MKRFLFCLLFCASKSFAVSDKNFVSSIHATYQDNTLALKGEVCVHHELGILTSEEALLQKPDDHIEAPFSSIHLEKDVRIALEDGGTLLCEKADLDFIHHTGSVFGGIKPILYTTLLQDKGAKKTLLTLQSNTLSFTFLQKQDESKAPQYQLSSLLAKDHVIAIYAEDLSLKADAVSFQGDLLEAFSIEKGSFCYLTYQGETIESSKIRVNHNTHCLDLQDPKGFLATSLLGLKEQGRIHLSCACLHLNQQEETLVLEQNVEIQENLFGSLSAKEQMIIQQKDHKITKIDMSGGGIFIHQDSSLIYPETMHLDGIKGEITAKATSEKKLFYADDAFLLQADDALCTYDLFSYEIERLLLNGNIKLESNGKDRPIHCGLADKLTFSPAKAELVLSSAPGKKVLFWDKDQNTMISAQEVHIFKNAQTGKTEIKGIGNVKLLLSQEENQLLKNSFSHLFDQKALYD